MGRNITRQRIVVMFVNFLISGCSDPVSFQPTDPYSQSNSSGLSKSEHFTQGIVSKKLDILFVIDNSASMAEEQQKMGERIDSFLDSLYDVDWQIGITTTDVSDGKYGVKGQLLNFVGTSGYILNKNTPNYTVAFKNTIQRSESYLCGTDCASGDEQPMRAAIMAIEKRNTENRGFFRSGADLGLLVLSDEDEKSSGPATATPAAEVVATVDAAWGMSKKLMTYGMIIIPDDNVCLGANSTGGHYGTFVMSLATLTGGLVGSICAENYAPTLGLLANHARGLLEYVQLRYIPVVDSVVIRFSPAHTSTWRIEGRRIYFNTPPPKGTEIYIDYTVL